MDHLNHVPVSVLLLTLLQGIYAKNSYFVAAPQYVRPGQTYNVWASIIKTVGAITVKATILQDNNTLVEKSVPIRSGTQQTLSLGIPLSATDGKYELLVTGSSYTELFSEKKDLVFMRQGFSVFTQTDKAVYKPGQLVRLRALAVYPSLLPVKSPMDISIFDPQGNKIKQWLQFSSPSGVFTGQLQLTEYTNLGMWKVRVEILGTTEEKTFEVKEYVLPRFQVTLNMPSLILRDDEFLTGTINALYTFGKGVKGDVALTIGQTWNKERQILKRFPIDGVVTFRVRMQDVLAISSYVEVKAEVTETLTGETRSDSNSISIQSFKEKLEFAPFMPTNFKPGLDYDVVLRLSKVDGTLLEDAVGSVNLTVSYQVPIKTEEKEKPTPLEAEAAPVNEGVVVDFLPPPRFPPVPQTETKYLPPILLPVTKDGLLTTTVKIPLAATSASLQASYRQASAYKSLQKFRSKSEENIQVKLTSSGKVSAGGTATFSVQSTVGVQKLEYMVVAKGTIVKSDVLSMAGAKTKVFSLSVTSNMAPKSTLVVYTIVKLSNYSEVLADAVTFKVEGLFSNELSMKFDKSRVTPATPVSLNIKAKPETEVHVLTVDKSVLLLKAGNDITRELVEEEIQKYNNGPFIPFGDSDFFRPFPVPIYGSDVSSLFDNSRLVIITDILVFKYIQPPTFWRNDVMMFAAGAAAENKVSLLDNSGSGSSPARVRTEFPETWLWESTMVNSQGEGVVNSVAPDTITTWIATAFGVNDGDGLGVVGESTNLTVFMNEFIRLTYPKSAIRGEMVLIQVDVFNYADRDKEYVVVFKKTQDFKVVDKNGVVVPADPGKPNEFSQSVKVGEEDVGTVNFIIIPEKVGDVPLTFIIRVKTATGENDVDAIRKNLEVKAEGIPQSYTIPVLKDLDGNTVTNDTVAITFPPNKVIDSEYIQVLAIGDIMGPIMANIGDLLQMSYGCGEQNLIRFVPNVFISDYLEVTNRLTGELKEKAERFLEAGYQREVSYRRRDGSFSAFGNNDAHGSTWLTALVVKSFAQAKGKTYIDPAIMTSAINFLIDQQRDNGSFNEPGKVIHKEMLGGSTSSQRSLAAFVLIALGEARSQGFVDTANSAKVRAAIELAEKFITSEPANQFDNMYELAIVLYALKTINVKPNVQQNIINILEGLATEEDGMKYWTLPSDQADTVAPFTSWKPPKTQSRALDIELTAYILLVYMKNNDLTNGLKVLKWLLSQQKATGGFVSTQDTMIAIQALTAVAQRVYSDTFSVTVTISNPETSFTHTFNINNNNALVLQQVEVPYTGKSSQDLLVTARGSGICLLEIDVHFHVEEELRAPSYGMSHQLINETINGFVLEVCFWWLKSGQSTMSVLDIGEPTGMEADIAQLDTSRASEFRRIERHFRKVTLYFNEVTPASACITIPIRRVALAAKHKPVPIVLSDYYEPGNKVVQMMSSKLLAEATIVVVCDKNGLNCVDVKKRK